MAFAEDPTLFFDTADFAVAVTYDGSLSVDGIFADAYREVNGMATKMPTFDCAEADVPAIAVGKQLVYAGSTYKVIDHRPDGRGFIKLFLNKVS